jgi:hypothetical protein
MLTRRRKKLTKPQALRATGRKYLVCSGCNLEEVEVTADIASVVCGTCVQKLVGAPAVPKPKSDKPRGWHLKPYFELNDIVYAKGIEVTDPDEIAELRKLHSTTKKSVAKKVSHAKKKGVRTKKHLPQKE